MVNEVVVRLVLNDGLSTLSDGERDCLRLVARGFSSKQIARMLAKPVSEHTVDQRLRTAMRKLGVTARQEAARLLATAEAETPYQPLIYQSEQLVSPVTPVPVEPTTHRGWLRNIVSLLATIFAFPPIGGRENDLTWLQRNVEILRIAILGTAIIIGLVLTVAGALSALR